MTVRAKVILASLWALSLLVTARWTASAQTPPQLGHEIRFIEREGGVGVPHRGTLVANFNGQWLPVTLDTAKIPDGNAF